MLEYDVMFSKPHLWPCEWLQKEVDRLKGRVPFLNHTQRADLKRLKRALADKTLTKNLQNSHV